MASVKRVVKFEFSGFSPEQDDLRIAIQAHVQNGSRIHHRTETILVVRRDEDTIAITQCAGRSANGNERVPLATKIMAPFEFKA